MCHPFSLGDWSLKSNRTSSGPWDLFAANMASLTVQMEAYAFRELVAHLQWRKDVQNIDLMNLAGFCRNCMAKWYHAGAKVHGVPMQYEEACERVYGEPYADWKKKNQKKASEDQLAVFESGKDLHARTEPKLLPGTEAAPGHSNVCGQGCDAPAVPAVVSAAGATAAKIAVLTASDRAAGGVYEDKSGPAVVEMLKLFSERNGTLSPTFVEQKVVPDDEDVIFASMKAWSESKACDVVITTGGTGFGPRDVTPEATRRLVVRLADALSRAMAWQTSLLEPRSVLSRGVCGVTKEQVLIVNLPGHPNAVRQCLSVLLPVLPHLLRMLG